LTDQTQIQAISELPPVRQVGRSLWADARRKVLRDRSAVACLIVIAIYILLAAGAIVYEALAPKLESWLSYDEMADYGRANLPPSRENPLGTDWAGRQVWIKTILGAKVSMTVAFLANIIAVPLGLALGVLAGYFGRRTDAVIVWLYSTLASIPGIILLIAIKFAFQNVRVIGLDLSGIHGVYVALGVISWIGTCRLVRAETMKVRELDFVVAAHATGRGDLAIIWHHILPNIAHIGIISFSLGFVGAISAEVILSYLGLGVGVGTSSWGTMINSARMDLLAGRWWELSSAVGAMFLLVLALNIFGDALRDALDPRLRNI